MDIAGEINLERILIFDNAEVVERRCFLNCLYVKVSYPLVRVSDFSCTNGSVGAKNLDPIANRALRKLLA